MLKLSRCSLDGLGWAWMLVGSVVGVWWECGVVGWDTLWDTCISSCGQTRKDLYCLFLKFINSCIFRLTRKLSTGKLSTGKLLISTILGIKEATTNLTLS